MGLIKIIRRYRKKLEKRLSRQIRRQQFNFQCDECLIDTLRGLAAHLEVPIYPLTEHTLQLGLLEITTVIQDDTLRERLCRHLLKAHLLVPSIQPESDLVTDRVLRLRNTRDFLRLLEVKKNPEEQKKIVTQLWEEHIKQSEGKPKSP